MVGRCNGMFVLLAQQSRLSADGKTFYERRFGEHFKGLVIQCGVKVGYHPITAKDKARLLQIGKKVLPSIFMGYAPNARGSWKRDILVVNADTLALTDAWVGSRGPAPDPRLDALHIFLMQVATGIDTEIDRVLQVKPGEVKGQCHANRKQPLPSHRSSAQFGRLWLTVPRTFALGFCFFFRCQFSHRGLCRSPASPEQAILRPVCQQKSVFTSRIFHIRSDPHIRANSADEVTMSVSHGAPAYLRLPQVSSKSVPTLIDKPSCKHIRACSVSRHRYIETSLSERNASGHCLIVLWWCRAFIMRVS